MRSEEVLPEPEEHIEDLKGYESVPVAAADVESAGRSCLAILILAGIIVILLFVWIIYRSTSGE